MLNSSLSVQNKLKRSEEKTRRECWCKLKASTVPDTWEDLPEFYQYFFIPSLPHFLSPSFFSFVKVLVFWRQFLVKVFPHLHKLSFVFKINLHISTFITKSIRFRISQKGYIIFISYILLKSYAYNK